MSVSAPIGACLLRGILDEVYASGGKMELGMVDLYVLLGAALSLSLTVCVAVFFLIRDPEHRPPHIVSRSVWCAQQQRHTTVDLVERVDSGITFLSVHHCPLRGSAGCHEQCAQWPTSEATEHARLWMTRQWIDERAGGVT